MKVILHLSCALLVASCAVRPLPEQATGITTFNIVKQIRCETREAAFNVLVNGLANNPDVFGEPARATAEGFRGHPELMHQFKPVLFAGNAREFVNFFWDTGIAYNFSLDMTEINDFGANVNLIQLPTGSTTMLGLGGGVDRLRENKRTFTITDDFKGLLNLKPRTYCDGHLATNEETIYPITGRIGVELFIREFVRVALFTNLKEDKDYDGAPTMVDTLLFNTFVSGSISPRVVFSPVGRAFQLADASVTAAASRRDVHTLTMGLSVIAAPPGAAASGGRQLFGRLLTSRGGGTKKAAAEAVDQELTRQALGRTIVVRP
ncbi:MULTISPECIES: hypothetical protein [unclassified Bradyrhizobium]|uniref:hypothetical protein n=1 Tax=unclassified Bradyrhizobium TaxID=2631580 RepID=UPI001FFBCCDA|nr:MULTISPECIES: hypothetical protein [unclassified Bradyrhizobium]MCK1298380.1 hypothetical protein [Bradyrhizobium sp. 37]MCK1771545.1 hypothetical protein [Bradyrhizobium sp. 134]